MWKGRASTSSSTAWRKTAERPTAASPNATYPARTGPARTAFDLHYLVSAHGVAEFAQEAILGHAMLALSGAAVLGREMVRRLLPVDAGADRMLVLAGWWRRSSRSASPTTRSTSMR